MARDTTHALSFGKAVADYEKGRPGYPDEAVDWMLAHASADPKVVDVGAGTGKFTASFVARGLDVTAVEPDAVMRGSFSTQYPTVQALEGTGEAIPLPDDSADLITFAQAWHWVDEAVASREAARVLAPTGTLALIWNIRDDSVDWVARLTEIMGSSAAEEYDSVTPPVGSPLQIVEHAEFGWQNPLRREQLLAMVTSRSYVIAMRPQERAEVLRKIDELLAEHPQLTGLDTYLMPYVTRVTLARRA